MRFDRLPAGAYVLRVLHVGFEQYVLRLTVQAACAERAEIYSRSAPTCRLDCPQRAPARATLTTCAPAR